MIRLENDSLNSDPGEVFDYTKKQRLQLLASLIADKIREDMSQGQPLLKRIEVERTPKRKLKPNRSLSRKLKISE